MSQPTGAQGGTGDPTQSGGAPAGSTADPNAAANGTDPAQGGQTGTPPAATDTVSRADFEAVTARMKAADKRAHDLETKAKTEADAKLSEAERVAKELDETKAKLAAADKRTQDQALENSILMEPTYSGKWHNPQTALSLVDRSLITFDDNGKPQGVKAALDKLAKDHAYLLKPVESGNDSNNRKGGATGASGTSRQQGDPDNTKSALERKYPALRGRVPINPS